MNAPAAAGSLIVTAMEPPPGFDELASPRVTLVDIYFGERKVGEALAVARPGSLQFQSPAAVLATIPGIVDAPELASALAAALPTNSSLVCSRSNAGDCGVLSPQVIGIIYDEDRFRADVFVNPKFLRAARERAPAYLPAPERALSLTNALGVNASGTIGGASAFNLQNRTILGFGSARLRANTSVASHLGVIVDDFVGELDSRNLRYSAGLFWAPGNAFTGQRRIIGAGVGTQFDTWADQDSLHGTPLVLFLPQPARVELLVDGRLVSSRSYPSGNVDLDTSALSDGSYSVLLRIHQSNGSVREERRFFLKNAQVPPAGHPVFYAYAGMLANTRPHRPVSPSGTFYYQAGTAWRLSNNFALDAAVLGTQRKAVAQAGAWVITGPVRLRAAGLASSAGDAGALVQMSTAGHGPLNISFDLRRIWSRDGKPLVPSPSYASTFDVSPPSGVQLANGSYTQATGSIGLRLGAGYVSITGSYRKDRNLRADYNIGPSVSWPLASRNGLQVVLDASAQRTRSTTAAFAGVRVLFASGGLSMLSTVGRGYQSTGDGPGRSVTRAVSTFSAQYSRQTEDGAEMNLEAGADRNIDSSTVHAGATLDNRFGNFRADLLHTLEGRGGTQYNLAYQSGIAMGPHAAAAWGAREVQQSALVVSLSGDAPQALFDVLVDDAARGRIRAGQRLSLFVPPYRTYRVRIVPAAPLSVSFDSAAREVTLYPGNVRSLDWRAESFFTVFGQATTAAGAPISNALVQTGRGIAQTDPSGYFQVDVRRGEAITIASGDGRSCRVTPGNVPVKNDFASIGKVVCQ